MNERKLTREEKTEFDKCTTFEQLVPFLKSIDLNKMDEFGNTILHFYLKSLMHESNRTQYKKDQPYKLNPKQIIEELVKNGIDINAQSKKGAMRNTPLTLSIGLGYKSKEIFDTLVENGADVNKKIAHGKSPLLTALGRYYFDKKTIGYIIKKLIELGADAHLENDYGISAYSFAALDNNSETLMIFTEAGIKPSPNKGYS